MHLIGRWERVRAISHQGIGPAYFLDRKWNILKTIPGERYICPGSFGHHVKVGKTWCHPVSGGAFNYNHPMSLALGFVDFGGTLGPTTHSLDSTFTLGSAGDATGGRLALSKDRTLTDFYFFIGTYTGTAANVNDIDWILMNDDGANAPNTGSIVTQVNDFDPGGATGWHRILNAGSVVLTSGLYWWGVGDPDGNGTDFAQPVSQWRYGGHQKAAPSLLLLTALTTDGFSSFTDATAVGNGVFVFSDGTALGWPYSVYAAPTSDTNQKGLFFGQGSLLVDLKLFGVAMGATGDVGTTGFNIWQGTDGPGGSPFATESGILRNPSTFPIGAVFSGVKLLANTDYRVVADITSAHGDHPDRFEIGDGADANLKKAMLGGGKWYWTAESGGSWSDEDDVFPNIVLYVEDVVDPDVVPVGGGGGGGRTFPVVQ